MAFLTPAAPSNAFSAILAAPLLFLVAIAILGEQATAATGIAIVSVYKIAIVDHWDLRKSGQLLNASEDSCCIYIVVLTLRPPDL